jgi:hypothetical protein
VSKCKGDREKATDITDSIQDTEYTGVSRGGRQLQQTFLQELLKTPPQPLTISLLIKQKIVIILLNL